MLVLHSNGVIPHSNIYHTSSGISVSYTRLLARQHSSRKVDQQSNPLPPPSPAPGPIGLRRWHLRILVFTHGIRPVFFFLLTGVITVSTLISGRIVYIHFQSFVYIHSQVKGAGYLRTLYSTPPPPPGPGSVLAPPPPPPL